MRERGCSAREVGLEAGDQAAQGCQVFAEVPPRAEYTLTDLGLSLIEPLAAIGDWAEVNAAALLAARARAADSSAS